MTAVQKLPKTLDGSRQPTPGNGVDGTDKTEPKYTDLPYVNITTYSSFTAYNYHKVSAHLQITNRGPGLVNPPLTGPYSYEGPIGFEISGMSKGATLLPQQLKVELRCDGKARVDPRKKPIMEDSVALDDCDADLTGA